MIVFFFPIELAQVFSAMAQRGHPNYCRLPELECRHRACRRRASSCPVAVTGATAMPLRNDAAVRPILAIDTASVGGLIQASRAAALFLVVENKKQTGLPTTPLISCNGAQIGLRLRQNSFADRRLR